jgi:uncharacterized protein (DUF1684 family)
MTGTMKSALLAVAMTALAGATLAAPADAFQADWQAWRERRLATLRKPQGWLALVGLHWLQPGENRLPGLPGAFLVAGGEVRLRARAEDGYTVGGQPATDRALAIEGEERLEKGSLAAVVIRRGDRLALRVWDASSPLRTGFRGIETFPFEARWRITARWEPFDKPRRVEQPTVLGTSEPVEAPGRAVFSIGGQEHALTPTSDGDDLFFVFKDRTAPRETYGAGRFLVAGPPRDGVVILDFNRAYNPPCAFTPFATCPLPLPENVLPIRVEAGERKWGQDH